MNDITFNPGGIKDIPDVRDYEYGEEIGNASQPFDWHKGYDIEDEIGFTLTVKDQGQSSSCGGQAWGYYGQAWDAIIDKENSEKSAKFIYSQTFVPSGGSAGRPNCDVVIKKGWAPEAICPSYSDGKPLTEELYRRPQDITPTAIIEANKDRAFAYANVSIDIELIAQAIRDNHGCIVGITGTNNGTWLGNNPQPPVTLANSWNHWVYAGKVRQKHGKKQIGILNSWGENVGEDGWQWIDEKYFTTNINAIPVVFSIWTLEVRNEPIPEVFKHYFYMTLKYGKNDPENKNLQTALQLDGCFPKNVNTTTFFGQITLSAVKTFQKKYGLKADGIVGNNTNNKLNELFNK